MPVAGVEYLDLCVVIATCASTSKKADAITCNAVTICENKPVRPIRVWGVPVGVGAIGVRIGRVVIIRAGLVPPGWRVFV